MEHQWTITELVAATAAALETPETPYPQTATPNERAVRWYATIGLLDPPLSRRGRIAQYGRRHLLQLLALKRRQAAGRTLADIQTELVGATDAYLERVAALSPSPDGASTPTTADTQAPAANAADTTRFWSSRPTTPTGATETTTVVLAPGVRLQLDNTGHTITDDDTAALRAAATPLLDVLHQRDLHQHGPPHSEGASP